MWIVGTRVSQSFSLPVQANWEKEISCNNVLFSGRTHEYFLLPGNKKKAYRVLVKQIMNQTKEIKAKEKEYPT